MIRCWVRVECLKPVWLGEEGLMVGILGQELREHGVELHFCSAFLVQDGEWKKVYPMGRCHLHELQDRVGEQHLFRREPHCDGPNKHPLVGTVGISIEEVAEVLRIHVLQGRKWIGGVVLEDAVVVIGQSQDEGSPEQSLLVRSEGRRSGGKWVLAGQGTSVLTCRLFAVEER